MTIKTLQDEVEQLRVQLAGCSVAALGGTNDPAAQGAYGWSVAYQDVLNLRHYTERLQAALREASQNVGKVAVDGSLCGWAQQVIELTLAENKSLRPDEKLRAAGIKPRHLPWDEEEKP